ncbi:MAG: inositol phosphorylceramide synthase [Labilithrix sp.]|nr:inositol phosphorylceramide synthase [Labilithrix sp.]MCW5832684.1 inositol phosphorylceramide synthase [Labilithrix sp.]
MIARLGALRDHVRRLWPRYPLAPLVPFVLYALVSTARGDLRPEHVGAVLLVLGLAYTNARTKSVLVAVYPIGLVGLLYDGMRPLQRLGLTPERVHVCDVRALEARLFGFEVDGATITLHDWFRVHHWPAIDLLAAFPYATFILVSFACAVFLALRDRPAMRRFTWAFFAMNVAGFVTYHLFPAAPPWYFHAHGCAVDLATRASEGPALMRVDAMLGVAYFHGMYAKASSVFGAIPSLHCAYPMLVVLEGWRSFGPRLRALAVAYWLLMVFASIYLDHHWLLDGILGSAYAVITSLVLRRLVPSTSTTEPAAQAATGTVAEAE